MGVDVDKYFGYVMDVTEQANQLRESGNDLLGKYVDGDGVSQDLINLGFVAHYRWPNKPTTGDIELVDDGMNGEYTKLVYIMTVDRYCNDYSEANKAVNDALANVPVPDDVKEKLNKAYSLIFDNEDYPKIVAEQFSHFH